MTELWQIKNPVGRPRVFKSPEDMLETATAYFEWVVEHPLWEAKAFAYQGEVKVEKLPKMRAMTLDGLWLHMGITRKCWDSYRQREEFLPVVTRIETIIREQKFTGAAAELLNPNIIARDLGLADKQDLSSTDGTMTPKAEMTDEQMRAKLEKFGIEVKP